MRRAIGSVGAHIGGLQLGLELAGWGPVRWQTEEDHLCGQVLKARWPGATRYGELRAIDPASLRSVGLLCGRVTSSPIRRPKNRRSWWEEVVRILAGLDHPHIVIEGPLAGQREWRAVVERDLATEGYRLRALALGALDVGLSVAGGRSIFLLAAADEGRRAAVGAAERLAPAPERAGGPGPASPADGPLAGGGLVGADGSADVAESGVARAVARFPHGLDLRVAGQGGPQAEGEAARTQAATPQARARLRALARATVPRCAEVAGRLLLEMTGQG